LVHDYGDVNRRIAIVNLLGNIAMFLPLGFFPPLLWKPFQKWWKMLLWGGLIIAGVELIQLFALVGNCDIDDLLLNSLGYFTGYGIYLLVKTIAAKFRERV
jgi:glycopeptide antibiotics resistance protein